MNRMRLLSPLLLLALGTAPLAAESRTTIAGHVTGADGRPLPMAHVSLLREGMPHPAMVARVGADGSFTIATDLTGPFTLRATGVSHAPYDIPLLIETPRAITLDIRLATRLATNRLDGVKAVGDFNDWNTGSAKPFVRQPDGTYAVTIEASFSPFGYQLLLEEGGGETFTMNGTRADSFAYDGAGAYRSMIAGTAGSVTITLDPSQLPAPAPTASVAYGDSATARIAAALNGIERRREEVMPEMMKHLREHTQKAFAHDWSARMRELAEAGRREKNPLVRNTLLLAYLDLTTHGGPPPDPKIARAVLAELKPGSVLWIYDPRLMEAAIGGSGIPEAYDAYRWRMVESRPDTSSRLDVLLTVIKYAEMRGDNDLLARYGNYVMTHFPKTGAAKLVRYEYSPNRAVMVGKLLPHFALPSLDNASEIVSDELMKGRTYLIDFWATWCGPCVAEMATLHSAYEKYRARNFEIVTISFDARPEDVARYRRGNWTMPWRHALVEEGFQSAIAERFEVGGIPKLILVDANGRIVAVNEELRGEYLDRTLERVLGGMN